MIEVTVDTSDLLPWTVTVPVMVTGTLQSLSLCFCAGLASITAAAAQRLLSQQWHQACHAASLQSCPRLFQL